MKSPSPRLGLAGTLALLVLSVGALMGKASAAEDAGGQILEPPADVPEGEDHAEAADDSLPGESVEVGVGLVGSGRSVERRRRVSFSGGGLSGTVREGKSDPLAGGSLLERWPWGELRAGKLSPRWNRGLLLGSPGDPWESAALEEGRRGRSGEGAALRLGGMGEILAGRFGGASLGGLRLAGGPVTLGLLGSARRGQAAFGLAGAREALELAAGPGGAWRGETVWRRGGADASLVTAIRAGTAGFRSLAEPRRAGPARAVTTRLVRRRTRTRLEGLLSVWRFRPAQAGSRAAVQLECGLAGGGAFEAGFEEQQGYRGELRSNTGLRQGGWVEWSTAPRPLGLAVRQETWGARAPLREVTRAVSSCRIEARLPRGIRVSLAHLVYSARRGESLYLRETESDRLVLRALSGEGQRTRVELHMPLARGTVRGSGQFTSPLHAARTARWALEWTRRARTGGSTPEGPEAIQPTDASEGSEATGAHEATEAPPTP